MIMKKVLDSFINQNHDAFTDSFEEHKRKNLINREDYIELQEESKKIYEKYPQIREFVENNKPMNFEKEEMKAFNELVTIFSLMDTLELIEAYKLGAKEAYIFLEEMDMLNI